MCKTLMMMFEARVTGGVDVEYYQYVFGVVCTGGPTTTDYCCITDFMVLMVHDLENEVILLDFTAFAQLWSFDNDGITVSDFESKATHVMRL